MCSKSLRDRFSRIYRILEGKEDERLFGKKNGEVKEEKTEKRKPETPKDSKGTKKIVINGTEIEVPEGYKVLIRPNGQVEIVEDVRRVSRRENEELPKEAEKVVREILGFSPGKSVRRFVEAEKLLNWVFLFPLGGVILSILIGVMVLGEYNAFAVMLGFLISFFLTLLNIKYINYVLPLEKKKDKESAN